ncbi:VCBS repeat-containing protein [Candidatus Acetothermia bacterium]|nr:VCBS repeat-containing protein [Candidatus Acetothermia bacterium]MBI3643019.1 VCBS repeat-containing protein [Candidatus Acetothermia bacterium]
MRASSNQLSVLRGGLFFGLFLMLTGLSTIGQQGVFTNFLFDSSRIPNFVGDGRSVAVGDVDGDGDLDMFVGTNEGNARDRLLINDGKGHFTDETTTRMPPKSGFAFTEDAKFADIDNDGDLDLIMTQSDVDKGDQNLIFVNNGKGFFSNETLLRLPGGPVGPMQRTYGVAVGDVNGDGKVDLFFANGFGEPSELLVNDGTGRFRDNSSSLPISAGALNAASAAFADVDGDGDLDLWIGSGSDKQDRVPHLYINDGLGHFDDQTDFRLSFNVAAAAFATLPVDVNGDGAPDVIFCSVGSRAKLLINNGQGFFIDETNELLPFDAANCYGLAAGDFDGDGDQDIALARDPNDNLHRTNEILINSDGKGHFIASPLLQGKGGGFSTAFIDADGDGDLDLIFFNQKDHQFWLNQRL